MKAFLQPLLLICLAPLLMLASCSQKDAQGDIVAPPQEITLTLAAESDLNSYDGVPASLTVCIYQLSSRRDFDGFADDPEQFRRLLQNDKFADSVLARQRCFVNPGERRVIRLERRPGAQYVALAAGYHTFAPGKAGRVLPLPPPGKRIMTRPNGPAFVIHLAQDEVRAK